MAAGPRETNLLRRPGAVTDGLGRLLPCSDIVTRDGKVEQEIRSTCTLETTLEYILGQLYSSILFQHSLVNT